MQDHARNNGFQSNKELMLYLKDSGYIRSNFIFDIMDSVDRKNFMTDHCSSYRDRPEVVAYGKTISAPHMHAEVLEHMSDSLCSGKYALDIGSGSGYLTVCMALALGKKGTVIGVDCIPGFQNMANKIVKNHYPELFDNNRVKYIVSDGRRGWPWSGPYNIIHVGVAAASIPETLIEQLAPGGCLLMPVGLENQVLVLLKKSLNGIVQRKELLPVKYGTFIDVNLPWSSIYNNFSVVNQKIESNNSLVPKSQNNATMNESCPKKTIKKEIKKIKTYTPVENETFDNINKTLTNITTNQNINLIGDSFWKSLGNISVANKPDHVEVEERKAVLQKDDIFEIKADNCPKLKSPENVSSMNNFEILKTQENITANIDSIIEDSDETNTVGTEIDVQVVHNNEDENSGATLANIQLNQKIHDISKSFSKSLENFATTNEPISHLQSSISTVSLSDKNKTQNVREKIEIFEKNIANCKTTNSPENITMKIKLIPKESDNAVIAGTYTKDTQIFDGKSKNIDEAENVQVHRELHGPFSTSLDISTKTNELISNVPMSTILESDKTKVQTAEQEIDIDQEKTENSQNNMVKLCFVGKEQNQSPGDNYVRVEEPEKSNDQLFEGHKMFKSQAKVMVDNFMSTKKEHSEKNNLREININLDRVKQIQFMNNHDSQQKRNSENIEQTGKFSMKVIIEERDSKSNELQMELRNEIDKVVKLQAQYDKNIEKSIAINDKWQERALHCQHLEERLHRLEQRFKLCTRILANLIEKIKCHEKVLKINLSVDEKEEASRVESRVIEKQKREKTKEKIDKLTSIISLINEEIQEIGCSFVDNTSEGEDQNLVKQSEPIPDPHFSCSESFLSELNLIKSLLYSGKESPTIEDESYLNNESESASAGNGIDFYFGIGAQKM